MTNIRLHRGIDISARYWVGCLATILAWSMGVSVASGGPIHIEAESGALIGGVTVVTNRAGFSGKGYVTGFNEESDRLSLRFEVPAAGVYDLRIRYSSPTGPKGFTLIINDLVLSDMFPGTGDEFATYSVGRIELHAGINTFIFEKGWGHFDLDCLEMAPAGPIPALVKPSASLSDPDAIAPARQLMGRLVDGYGKTCLGGVYSVDDSNYVRDITGRTPAILGADLIDFSPTRRSHGADPKDLVAQLIKESRGGRVITLSWHWNAPSGLIDKEITDGQGKTVDARWYKGFNTNATTFDVRSALSDANGADYQSLLSDIDAIAVPLKQLADANVPVLWRPLHEAEGGWFWWGSKGSDSYVKLWRLLHDRLTQYHKLHNLIWVYTTGGAQDWYPGDRYVDILGVDNYPVDLRDPIFGLWDTLIHGVAAHKLLALTEFGGVPDIARMRRLGVRWAYFVSWEGDLGPKKMRRQDLVAIYDSEGVVNLK